MDVEYKTAESVELVYIHPVQPQEMSHQTPSAAVIIQKLMNSVIIHPVTPMVDWGAMLVVFVTVESVAQLAT